MLSKPVLCVWLVLVVASSVIGNTAEEHGVNQAITKRQTFTAEREYHLGFPLNYQYNSGTLPVLVLMTSEITPVSYTVDVPYLGQTYTGTITAGGEAFIEFPHDVQVFGDPAIENKGIHVQLDSNNVVVIGENVRRDTDGTFLTLPTLDLNITQYKYFELTMVIGAGRWPSELLVVGTQNNTTINITVSQSVRLYVSDGQNSYVDLVAGMEYSYNIDELQTFFMTDPDDLTGTRITTDKPISLFSGHACAELPLNGGDCDHMIEQLLPTVLWGTTHYIAPVPRIGTAYFIRVLAANDGTDVDIYCNNTHESHTINEGEYVHKELGKLDHCAIHSSKEVLVAEYASSPRHGGFPSDAAMALVPATIHYSNKVLSSTILYSSDLGYIHSLIVIVLAEYYDPSMIYFESGGNSEALTSQQWVPIQVNSVVEAYYTHINNISTGTFEVFHTDQNALLNTMLFGLSVPLHGAYGHAGRLEVGSATDPGGSPSVSGDPHFSIPLPSNEILCYSIQGYAGLAFNLISNDHITINALFIDSINDQTEATWIGKLAVITSSEDGASTVTFNSVDQEVEIENEGKFKASVIEQININSHDNITVKFTKGMKGNSRVRVVYSKLLAIFDVAFHSNHLDIDWVVQENLMENSHGLMGQFMNKYITVDPVKEILIRPGFDAIPVAKDKKWQYNDEEASSECWRAMNVGHQGEKLIDGTILDYIVEGIKQKKFTFIKK